MISFLVAVVEELNMILGTAFLKISALWSAGTGRLQIHSLLLLGKKKKSTVHLVLMISRA